MKATSLIKFSGSLLLPLAVGAIGGYFTTTSIDGWYSGLNKPSFNPPNFIFGPVWTTLYVVMGISFYKILISAPSQIRTKAIGIYLLQLALNLIWSFLFFYFHALQLALTEIILLWISILWMISEFSKVKPWYGYLQIPYLLWVTFASILNGTIWYLN